jgi:hypothetical protein
MAAAFCFAGAADDWPKGRRFCFAGTAGDWPKGRRFCFAGTAGDWPRRRRLALPFHRRPAERPGVRFAVAAAESMWCAAAIMDDSAFSAAH